MLNGKPVEIEQNLFQLLTEDGFDINRIDNGNENIKIIAVNRIKLPRLFFLLKRPEIINIALSAENVRQTRMELSYKFSGMFLFVSYLVLTLIIGMMFCCVYFKFTGEWRFVVRSAISINGYIALMYVLFRILIRTHDATLFNRLKATGYSPQITNTLIFMADSRKIVLWVMSIVSIGAIILVINSLEIIVWLLAFLGVCWFVLLTFLFPLTSRLTRAPHFVVSIFITAAFALYGFLPIFILSLPVTKNSLLIGLFCPILAILSLIVTRTAMFDLLKSVSFIRNNSEQIEVIEKRSYMFSIAVIVIWIFLSFFSFFSFLSAAGLIEFLLCGKNNIFSIVTSSDIIYGATKALLPLMQQLHLEHFALSVVKATIFCYFMPIVLMAGYIILSNLWQIIEYVKLIINEPTLFDETQKMTGRIVNDAKISNPYLRVIKSDYINAYCLLPPIPFMRTVVVFTSACQKLSGSQLQALIAHEMGHLKLRHSFLFSILNFVSRWTFLGEGFAVLLIKSSKAMEMEADAFAVAWLEKNTSEGKKVMIDLLRTLETQRIKLLMAQAAGKSLNAFPAFTSNCNAEKLLRELDDYSGKSFFAKRHFDFRMLSFFIFHGWLSTYIHVPYDARIKYIQELKS